MIFKLFKSCGWGYVETEEPLSIITVFTRWSDCGVEPQMRGQSRLLPLRVNGNILLVYEHHHTAQTSEFLNCVHWAYMMLNNVINFHTCTLNWSQIKWEVLQASTQTVGAFTLLTSRFLKARHFDPTIYTCAKNSEVSVSRNFVIFWLVVCMCDHRLQCMHSCMQYAWGPRILIHVSKSAHS